MHHFLKMSPMGYALLSGSVLLHIGLILLFIFGVLPLGTADFVFFLFLSILATMYRPGWMFLLLLSVLPLEIVNMAPTTFGIDIRPYQFLEVSMLVGLLVRGLLKKTLPPFPSLGFGDAFLLAIPAGAFLSIFVSDTPETSFKLALVLSSFGGIFLLARLYIQSKEDVYRVFPFIFASGLVTLGFSLFQGIRSTLSLDAFEVMPGRPNALFPEPDWLGMYIVFFGALIFSLGIWLYGHRRQEENHSARRGMGAVFFFALALVFTVLLLTVSRSAWLGMFASLIIFGGISTYIYRNVRFFWILVAQVAGSFLLALLFVIFIPLTAFDLSGRAGSIVSGDQKITVSCDSKDTALPRVLHDMSELSKNNCRHIDIEQIEAEKAAGHAVLTIFRPDPNVEIRKDIYTTSIQKIKEHPYLGIGWGGISAILGTDERGAGLNASNVFLEVWLGSGLLGLIGLVSFLFVSWSRFLRQIWKEKDALVLTEDSIFAIFFLSVIPGIIVFDLFNSGILLGFLWALFAVALVRIEKREVSEQS
mgnify:CR=1 FL=1